MNERIALVGVLDWASLDKVSHLFSLSDDEEECRQGAREPVVMRRR
jgi:hypothetical protein